MTVAPRPFSWICLLVLITISLRAAGDPARTALELRPGDVVAWVGGADVAAAGELGHLDTLLALQYPGANIHFRNCGWEGDTVFAQPRDVGFPPLVEQLTRLKASVVLAQFGRAEALDSTRAPLEFRRAYEKLIHACFAQTKRLVVIIPPPFESAGGALPDLSPKNAVLAQFAEVLRSLARDRSLPVIDLFAAFGGAAHAEPRLTENGLQLSPQGHALAALAFARQAGFGTLADRIGNPKPNGTWTNDSVEALRQAVIERNRLWFHYWRPQNWAFLGGDRTSQPSSRDHLNPTVRWFPEEMARFLPLIEAKEREIENLVLAVRSGRPDL